ncbi:glucose dehydrogenase [FAD, quinone]-like [Nylanderia fulva]|uniref:glucose dehydrogenase [FAD, quinone]-like n=1 Tax=Nylanderia fulva TaxID=613905 RepID=UPI0010FB897E|nr:glucose dehydrogenase [FAD, quinone]-like [Nylanderia fulva]
MSSPLAPDVAYAASELNNYPIPSVPCSSPFASGLTLTDVCSASSGNLLLSLLTTLATYSDVINGCCERITPETKSGHLNGLFDFIVVGGGAAGPVVASRLSEISNWKVLLVEAGPDEPAGTQIPSNLLLYLNTDLDWKYKTQNETHACLNNGGSCSWPRGKNLGGCTSHHGMAYHRGHKMDYTKWVHKGNLNWSWDQVLPYFWKSENNEQIGTLVSPDYHVTGGPMTVERLPWAPQFAEDVLTAAKDNPKEFGITNDLVGDKITGFAIAQTISKNGVRLSAPRAFLWPNRNRKNLFVALNATATKIRTTGSGTNLKATGITFTMNGRTYNPNVRKEVILSAGSINSPQLLLLSGIGPKNQLTNLGIRSVLDLPGVGENLHNHQSYGIDFSLKTDKIDELNMTTAYEYLNTQTGPMSSTGLAQLTGILWSNYTTAEDPDIQFFFSGYQAVCDTGTRIPELTQHGTKENVRITSVNIQPRSRGRLTLASKDPTVHPNIWGNDLADPVDRSIVIQGIEKILVLSKTKPLTTKYLLTRIEETAPACKNYKIDSYEYWDCQIQWNTRPENHQSGTCKMGPSSDPMAVVSPYLKVHGIKGLRVADASIMPQVISGNPVAVVNMIGERAADFIKTDYGMNDI